MAAVLKDKVTANEVLLYMALKLSDKKWKLDFSDGAIQRQVTIAAGDWLALHTQIDQAKEKLKLVATCRIVSCYEAGRDGFWIHRRLLEDGIESDPEMTHAFDQILLDHGQGVRGGCMQLDRRGGAIQEEPCRLTRVRVLHDQVHAMSSRELREQRHSDFDR